MKNSSKEPTIDREVVFQLINNKEWQKLIDIFKNNENYNLVVTDSILNSFIDKYFIDELLNKSSLNNDPAYKYYLQDFFILHNQKSNDFTLNNDNYRKLIVKIVEVESEVSLAYKYALKFPEEEICKKVIEKYQEDLPKVIRHSQESDIYVTENKNVQEVDASISLFKSMQEYQFYKAIRDIYQTFLVLPNVSLNAVIDFDLIRNKLSQEERQYFFNALIDCVVIDAENNYKPIKFIELDSPYHDSEKQIQKDKYKDNILAVAGQKLIRVRRTTYKEDERDFIKLILETIKGIVKN